MNCIVNIKKYQCQDKLFQWEKEEKELKKITVHIGPQEFFWTKMHSIEIKGKLQEIQGNVTK